MAFFAPGCGTSALGESSIHSHLALMEPAKAQESWTPDVASPGSLPDDTVRPELPDRMARIAGASFDLDVTETTVDAYARCVAAGACTEPARVHERAPDEASKSDARCSWGARDTGTGPVNCVSFAQAKAYCAWAGKRLPTDAEWMMAATGVNGERRARASDITPDGVMQMGANVIEWVDGPPELRAPAARVTGFRCARDSRA